MSNFFNQITKIIQEALDAIPPLVDHPEESRGANYNRSIKATLEAINKLNTPKKLIACVKKNTNFTLRDVFITSGPRSYLNASVRFTFNNPKADDRANLLSSAMFKASRRPKNLPVSVAEFLQQLGHSVDIDTGKFQIDPSETFWAVISLDATFFISEKFLPNGMKFSAAAIASVFLHEFGHLVYKAYRCRAVILNTVALRSVYDELSGTTDRTSVYKAYELLRQVILTRDDPNSMVYVDCVKAFDKNPKDVGKWSDNAIYDLCLFIKMASAYLLSSGTKTEDMVKTHTTTSDEERFADTYSIRMGDAAAAAEKNRLFIAMNELEHLRPDTAIKGYKGIHYVFASDQVDVTYTLMQSMALLLDASPFVYSTKYDSWVDRMKLAREVLMERFKDPTIPESVKFSYLDKIKEIDTIVGEYTDTRLFKIRRVLFNLVSRIGSIGLGLHTSTSAAEYDVLQKLSRGLMQNEASYWATRLKAKLRGARA